MTTQSNRIPSHAHAAVLKAAEELVQFVRQQVSKRKPADRSAALFFSKKRYLGSRDRRFLSDLLFSFFRWLGWLKPIADDDLLLACALAYALDATTLPDCLDAFVKASRRPNIALKPCGGMKLDQRREWLESVIQRSCPLSSLVPEWIIPELFTPANVNHPLERCLEAFQLRPPVWLHVFRGLAPDIQRELHQLGIDSTAHSALPNALAVESALPSSLPANLQRAFIIQDLASQCVATICAPREGETWLDACAGAGGKTLHLADLMHDKGTICAEDVRPEILRELSKRARHAGFSCISTRCGNAAEPFDGVLIDAPCSGIGTWSRNPDARWRIRKSDIGWARRRQFQILERNAPRVRPGGILVYSVCTLTRAETVEVVTKFLKTHPEFSSDPFPNPLRPQQATDGQLWIWPWEGPCIGMFVARFRRMS